MSDHKDVAKKIVDFEIHKGLLDAFPKEYYALPHYILSALNPGFYRTVIEEYNDEIYQALERKSVDISVREAIAGFFEPMMVSLLEDFMATNAEFKQKRDELRKTIKNKPVLFSEQEDERRARDAIDFPMLDF